MELKLKENNRLQDRLICFINRNTAVPNLATAVVKLVCFIFTTEFGLLTLGFDDNSFPNAFFLLVVPIAVELGINCMEIAKSRKKGAILWVETTIIFICYLVLSCSSLALLLGSTKVLALLQNHPNIFKSLVLCNAYIYGIETIFLSLKILVNKIDKQKKQKRSQRATTGKP